MRTAVSIWPSWAEPRHRGDRDTRAVRRRRAGTATAPAWTVKVPKIDLRGLTRGLPGPLIQSSAHLHAGATRYQRGTVSMAIRAAA